ncbi:DUF2867 domain-containing protein [Rufibacter sp. DG15C]|uniref:DUF2867 domain-containing protein n=1 Tax=Rufibacter sp. DG15C TaxID=1379909 RepID=UPI00082B5093|nr:DUF2867 domain-containing protein [Rufibacter sp. DG15C]
MKGSGHSSRIPDHSLLKKEDFLFDYMDSFQHYFFDREDTIDITSVGKMFFSSGSTWINGLFAIRNKVVGWIGLKTPEHLKDRKPQAEAFTFEPGQRLGLFKVFDKTAQEVVLGEDDRHLNFKVSLLLESLLEGNGKKRVSITTAVTFNNRFGRFYFMLVRPFHKIIVKTLLKRMVQRMESTKPLLAKQA